MFFISFSAVTQVKAEQTAENMYKGRHIATIVNAQGEIVPNNEALSTVGTVREGDSLALVAMYHSMQGNHWREEARAGWLVDPVPLWPGVSRVENVGTDSEPEWRVTVIQMDNWTLTRPGPIPPEIGQELEYLIQFRARGNRISGPIPANFGDIPQLRIIRLRTNLLTGQLPIDEISKLDFFELFEVHQNYFTGVIPPSIGDFPALVRFNVSVNHIGGEVPPEIVGLTTLRHFKIANNNITGPMPNLSHLERLERYRVSNNNFDPAPFPDWLINSEFVPETMRYLGLEYTNMTGTIPEKVADMPALQRLWIGNPGLEGPVPDMSVLPNIMALGFYSMDWNDEIPAWLGDVQNMIGINSHLTLYDINFTGTIPDNLAESGVTTIHLEKLNNLTGGIPNTFAVATQLEDLMIIDMPNLEVGPIPSWFSGLTNLFELRLENVGITGPFPNELQDITSLSWISFRGNAGMSGTLPEWLAVTEQNIVRFDISGTGIDVNEYPSWLNMNKFQNLEWIGLAGTGMTGPIPEFIGDINELRVLDLSNNQLSGPIPASLGNAQFMDSLNLSNNNLNGTIPAELANIGRRWEELHRLESLSISGNPNLEGHLPVGLMDAEYLRVLEFEDTKVCPPDAAFQNWIDGISERMETRYVASPDEHFSWEIDNRWFAKQVTMSVKYNAEYCKVTSADDIEERPFTLRLDQNYPNPFNPATTIRYEIPADMQVKLHVYNILGQQVASLVSEIQSAGRYEVYFDAASLASGSYVYRLQAGERVLVQNMMLIK